MLYRVEIENFYSIGERQVIDVRVRKSVHDTLGRLSPIFTSSVNRAPNVIALFGPNAAGKSNVLRAISFAVWFIVHSFSLRPGAPIPYVKFGSDHRLALPTRLSFSFGWYKDYTNPSQGSPHCPYTYELELSERGEGCRDSVLLEKLSFQPNGRGKPATIFERKTNGELRVAKQFLSTRTEEALKSVLRPEVSVVATLAQLNHQISMFLIEAMSGVVSNILLDRVENDEGDIAEWYAKAPKALAELQNIAQRIDLGINEIEVDNSSGRPQLQFRHSGLDQIIGLNRESHGTRQFIKVLPYILMALDQGGIAVVDEIDSAMHPLILPEILRWFGDKERNPNGAQLWTTCHSASLLTELTKEEVLFCEKDSQGNTSVFRLADVERVRRNENFFGKYLSGEYGAVPALG